MTGGHCPLGMNDWGGHWKGESLIPMTEVTFCSQPLNYQSNTAGHFNTLHLHVAKILQNSVPGPSASDERTRKWAKK